MHAGVRAAGAHHGQSLHATHAVLPVSGTTYARTYTLLRGRLPSQLAKLRQNAADIRRTQSLGAGRADLRRKNWLVAGRDPAKRLVPMIMSKLLPPKLRKHEPWNSLEVLLAVFASHP